MHTILPVCQQSSKLVDYTHHRHDFVLLIYTPRLWWENLNWFWSYSQRHSASSVVPTMQNGPYNSRNKHLVSVTLIQSLGIVSVCRATIRSDSRSHMNLKNLFKYIYNLLLGGLQPWIELCELGSILKVEVPLYGNLMKNTMWTAYLLADL